MTKTMKKLTAEEISTLRSIVGQEFRFVGGPEVPSYLVSDYFVLGGSERSISISGDTHHASLGDDSGEYSHLVIRSSTQAEIERSLKSGNVYLINRRSLILGVGIVTETLGQKTLESSDWEYEVDVAVVIRMASGTLVLQLVSHSVEAISVEFMEEFSLSKLASPSNSFEDDLIRKCETQLRLVELGPSE
jgi:hypothetical protein